MFEKASRINLHYDTAKGQIPVNELWNLPLSSTRNLCLDEIALDLHRQLKEKEEVSFVRKDVKRDEVLQLKFDIVKYIIDVKIAEAEAAAQAKQRADQKRQLLELIARKEGEQLAGLSLDELRAKVAELS